VRWLGCFLLVAACGKSPSAAPDPDATVPADTTPPVDVTHLDKSAGCVGTFGNALTNGHGRLDGTIVAILAPGNTTCPRPNSDHLILEVRMGGDVYRMVAAMESSVGNPHMGFIERAGALKGPAWSDGWHPGVGLDFVADIGVHRNDFTELPMLDLADAVTGPLVPGAKVSVFATVENADDSAHLIHRNFAGEDGAFVVDPDGSPRYLATRFDNQLF
jgi:hypothetical protein